MDTTNNDAIHLLSVQRALASQLQNLELKNKDKTAECEHYRLQTVHLLQQLQDLDMERVKGVTKPLLFKATSSLVQEVQPSTSKTGTKQ